jgi:threonine dehydrogenase-like Zn-dependent dehydrogenase
VFIEALEMVRKGGTVIEVGNWVDTGKTVPLNVMKHVASKNLHIHSVFHCGTNWRPVLNILQKQQSRYPFASLISHRMGLDELAANMEVVTDPNRCVKVEVVPHTSSSGES